MLVRLLISVTSSWYKQLKQQKIYLVHGSILSLWEGLVAGRKSSFHHGARKQREMTVDAGFLLISLLSHLA